MNPFIRIRELFPNKIFQRYLASNFIVPFAMSLTFFVSFLLTTQLFKFMRIVTKKGVSVFHFLEILGHISMSFIPMATPLSILFAMIYTLNKLSEDSEIVALRAMGINKHRIFFPYLFISVLVAAAVMVLNTNLAPTSKRVFRNEIRQLGSKGVMADIKKEQFFTDIPGVILFAENVEDDGKVLEGVFLKIVSDKNFDKLIMAKKGILNKANTDQNKTLNIRFDFYDGSIVTIDKSGQQIEKVLFEKYEYPIVSTFSVKSVNKASMMSSTELRQHLRKLEKKRDETDNQRLKKHLSRDLVKGDIEYWGRYTIPIQCIVFTLLGFVFGVKKGRGATKNTSAMALLVTIFYYGLYFSGISIAKKVGVAIPLILFLPAFITGLIGMSFYKKLDWNS